MKNIFILLSSFLFVACSPHGTFEYFNKSESFEIAMQNLRTGSLVEGTTTQALVHAVYLNPVDPELYKDDEHFFVAVYDETHKKSFKLLLNGAEPKQMIPLDKNSTLRASMPIKTAWFDYYHVIFEAIEERDFTITFENNTTQQATLKFSKDELKK